MNMKNIVHNPVKTGKNTCKRLSAFLLLTVVVFAVTSILSSCQRSIAGSDLPAKTATIPEFQNKQKLTTFTEKNSDVRSFIDEMVKTHHFERKWLEHVFNQATYQPKVIELITRPVEKTFTWDKYRSIFMKPQTIKAGVDFWYKNHAALSKAEKEYGVPAMIIAGILGVETRFGQNTGSYKVIDALSTLVFYYPPRKDFFKNELIKFLIFCDKYKMDPQKLTGSYAGAMGLTQFMPSNYRAYAVDFTKNGHADIWGDMSDAIGSVANYLNKHGWVRGLKITVPATIEGKDYQKFISDSPVPEFTLDQVVAGGLKNTRKLNRSTKVRGLKLQGDQHDEYWLTTKNFYVITRYNRSDLYAMAVYTLGAAIQKKYHDSVTNNAYRPAASG